MGRRMAMLCQLLGAVIGGYGTSSIMNDGVGWGSVFLGLVLIVIGSRSYLQHSALAKKQEQNGKRENS